MVPTTTSPFPTFPLHPCPTLALSAVSGSYALRFLLPPPFPPHLSPLSSSTPTPIIFSSSSFPFQRRSSELIMGVDGNSYTVAKMQLMSTTFKRVDGKNVWIGHSVLATKVIENGQSHSIPYSSHPKLTGPNSPSIRSNV